MTTAIATVTQADSTPSLPERGLQLLNDRPPIDYVPDGGGGKYLQRIQYPALIGEDRAVMEKTASALAILVQPGRRAAIVGMLARLAAHRPKDRTPQEWQMLLEDYAEDLGEFSEAHIAQAIKTHRRNNVFFPAIAELRGQCLDFRAVDQYRLKRAKELLDVREDAE